MQRGEQSIRFKHPPKVIGRASIVTRQEGKGPYGSCFDQIVSDPKMGQDSWEKAEGKIIAKAANLAIQKADIDWDRIRYIVTGDLLGQLMASTFGMMEYEKPLFGVYGACSTMGEALSIAAILLDGGYADHVLAVTSSHFASAEKQFRFPLAYGNQRPKASTWTVTGSGAVVLASSQAREGKVQISGITTGKIIDFGIKDSMNMGACMAPPTGNIEQ